MSDNPFFESWTTPFGMPPFDRIRPEHFPLAFDRAMVEHNAEIEFAIDRRRLLDQQALHPLPLRPGLVRH